MSLRNKLFGVAVAASMITGAVIPAMAATITIENTREGITYSAYKIFDIDHSNGSVSPYDGYAYTILESNPWKTAVQSYISNHSGEITLTPSAKDSGVFVVTIGATFNPVTFGEHLESQLVNGSFVATASTENDNVITVNDPGYYLVHADDGLNSLAVLVNSTDNKVIVDKNNHSISKTFADGSEEEFAAIGDTVSYKITSQIPYRPDGASDNYAFTITDTMPAGFELNKGSFSVQIGTDPALDEMAYTFTPNKTDNSFTLVLPINDNDNVGKTITITYSGQVTNSVSGVTNSSNEGNTNTVTGTVNRKTISDSATFYTASYQIKKTNTEGLTLAGAVFTLSVTDGETTKYYSEDNNGNVSWVTNPDALDENVTSSNGVYRVTGDDGILTFKGLDADKDYTLTEVKAPTGYNLLTESKTISFKTAGETEYTGTGAALVLAAEATEIENNKGMQLPETGGMGTTLFYVAGGTLVAGAAVLLITRKRMSEAE